MFYLSDILQFVINGLNQSPFPKHNLVGDGHERVPHIVLDFGDKLNPVHKKEFKQLFAKISFVTTEFAFDIFNKRLRVERLSVIDIARCEHEVQYLPSVIDDQMQLETEEPSHRAFATFCYAFESLVNKDTLMFTDPQRR